MGLGIGLAIGAGVGLLTGGDTSAGSDAAGAMNAIIQNQYRKTKKDFKPVLQAGRNVLPDYIQSSTDFEGATRSIMPYVNDFLDDYEFSGAGAAGDYMQSVGLDRPQAAFAAGQLEPEEYLTYLMDAEQGLYGNRGGLAGLGLDAASYIGNLAGKTGDMLSGNLMQGGLTDAQTSANNMSNMINLAGTGAILGFLSDERTKENIRQVGEMDDGTPIYTWDWKPGFGEGQSNIGPLAQDVQAKYPDQVTEENGYLKILPGLGDEVAHAR